MLWSWWSANVKDAEPGNKEINIERTEEVLETKPDIIARVVHFVTQ
jgi:hypothetical protein